MKKRSELLQSLIRIEREIEMFENVLVELNPIEDVHIDVTSNFENERPTFFNIPNQYFVAMIRKQLSDLKYRFNQIKNELEDYSSHREVTK